MPRRPPKEWWNKTVRRLKKIRGIKSPERLAGWVWHHQMKPATKKAILKASESVKRGIRRRRRR